MTSTHTLTIEFAPSVDRVERKFAAQSIHQGRAPKNALAALHRRASHSLHHRGYTCAFTDCVRRGFVTGLLPVNTAPWAYADRCAVDDHVFRIMFFFRTLGRFHLIIPGNQKTEFRNPGWNSRLLLPFKVGLGILQITSAKRCPQVWPCFGRSLFSTDFVEYDPAV